MSAPGRFVARTAAYARLEAVRTLRAPGTLMAALVFAAIHALGRWQEAGSDSLFIIGALGAFAIGFTPDLSADRALSFDRLLVLNFLSPVEYAMGKTAAMVAWLAGSSAFACGVGAAFSGGDFRFAAWHGALILLLGVAALPAVGAVDLLLGIRRPAAATLVLAFVILLVLAGLDVQIPRIAGALGVLVTPYSYESLGPLGAKALLALALTPALVAATVAVRARRPRKARGTGASP